MVHVQEGDFIIFKKWKSSTHPSPRAKDLYPSPMGETYWYRIDKFWKVIRVIDSHTLEVETRRGKRRRVANDESSLRKVGLLDKWLHRDRFF